MKILHLTFFTLISVFTSYAFACKPSMPPNCKKPNVKVDVDAFVNLRDQTTSYHTKLTTYMDKNKKGKTSCFGLNLVNGYVEAVEHQLQHNNGKACAESMRALADQAYALVGTDKEEFKTIQNADDKADLRKHAKDVANSVEQFKKKHSLN